MKATHSIASEILLAYSDFQELYFLCEAAYIIYLLVLRHLTQSFKMPTESEVHSSCRYLLCNCFFSDDMIDKVKNGVERFMVDKEKDDQYFQFTNWQKQKNEVAVLTMYS